MGDLESAEARWCSGKNQLHLYQVVLSYENLYPTAPTISNNAVSMKLAGCSLEPGCSGKLKPPGFAAPNWKTKEPFERGVVTWEEVQKALAAYMQHICRFGVTRISTHISSDLNILEKSCSTAHTRWYDTMCGRMRLKDVMEITMETKEVAELCAGIASEIQRTTSSNAKQKLNVKSKTPRQGWVCHCNLKRLKPHVLECPLWRFDCKN